MGFGELAEYSLSVPEVFGKFKFWFKGRSDERETSGFGRKKKHWVR